MAVSVGKRIIAEATRELGVAEQPPGSNRGPKVEQYQQHDWIPGGGYPWCVSFAWGFTVWHRVLGRPNPYPTASVAQLAAWARKNGWAVANPQPGDLVCLGGGRHVTIYLGATGNGWFDGLGGNQSHRVQISRYRASDITTVVRVKASPKAAPPPARKPRWEVVRGDGERTRVVYTGTARLALERVRRLVRNGRDATIRRRRP